MDIDSIKNGIIILINKYIPERQDLIKIVYSWKDMKGIPVKFIFSEIDKYKKVEYSDADKITIREIASIFV